MTLTFGSLFAGVGGFDMGFEQAGWDCKFQVEWDKNCQQILNKHWPDVPKWLDVSDVNGAEIPPVDCIIFGSPCQDLSVAGARRGLSGERSGLFHEAVRIIKEMRDATNGTFPRWTVWENVAGALSSNNGRDFGTVINESTEDDTSTPAFSPSPRYFLACFHLLNNTKTDIALLKNANCACELGIPCVSQKSTL